MRNAPRPQRHAQAPCTHARMHNGTPPYIEVLGGRDVVDSGNHCQATSRVYCCRAASPVVPPNVPIAADDMPA